jgi:hypothetical protein
MTRPRMSRAPGTRRTSDPLAVVRALLQPLGLRPGAKRLRHGDTAYPFSGRLFRRLALFGIV